MKISTLSDAELLTLSEEYGLKAKFWYRKFLGLLTEINRRKLFEKKKCVTICEFAAKFGGISKEQVERVVCTERTFVERGTMQLREMLITGEVSMHKLTRIVSIACKENENILVHAVKNLPQDSLEAYVRDQKFQMQARVMEKNRTSNEQSNNRPDNVLNDLSNNRSNKLLNNALNDHDKNVRSHTFALDRSQGQANLDFENIEKNVPNINQLLSLGLNKEVVQRLSELKAKGFDVNQILTALLDTREKKIIEEKAKTAEDVEKKEQEKNAKGEEVTRHIPKKAERILEKEFGTKCAVHRCSHEADHIHHTARFELTKSHNPYFLAPLCKQHHDIAHVMDSNFLIMKNGAGNTNNLMKNS